MKLEKINLYKYDTKIEEDEFVLIKSEEVTVPLVLTNRAINYAHQNGVIKSSVIGDLVSLSNMGDDMEGLEDMKILETIYTAYIGGQFILGKKEPELDFDNFTEHFQASSMEQVEIYQKILIGKENQFIKEIEKSTKKGTEKGEKK